MPRDNSLIARQLTVTLVHVLVAMLHIPVYMETETGRSSNHYTLKPDFVLLPFQERHIPYSFRQFRQPKHKVLHFPGTRHVKGAPICFYSYKELRKKALKNTSGLINLSLEKMY